MKPLFIVALAIVVGVAIAVPVVYYVKFVQPTENVSVPSSVQQEAEKPKLISAKEAFEIALRERGWSSAEVVVLTAVDIDKESGKAETWAVTLYSPERDVCASGFVKADGYSIKGIEYKENCEPTGIIEWMDNTDAYNTVKDKLADCSTTISANLIKADSYIVWKFVCGKPPMPDEKSYCVDAQSGELIAYRIRGQQNIGEIRC